MASKDPKVLFPQVMKKKRTSRRRTRTRRTRTRSTRTKSWHARKTTVQTRRSTTAFWRNSLRARMKMRRSSGRKRWKAPI